MKKNLLITTTFALLMLLLINACKKGDVTQEDIIVDQQKIALTIRVVNASDGLAPVSGALVKILTSDGVDTVQTDADGLAWFEKVAITSGIPVTVTKADYTSVSTMVYGIPSNYRQSQISSDIEVYELTGDNIAVIRGTLTAETNVINREREAVPAGLVVRAYNDNLTNQIAFIGETDAEGNYTINVPVSSQGNDDIYLVFPEFTANQTVALEDDDDITIEVVERPVFYNLQIGSAVNAIPGVPSVYATVEAPTSGTAGSGFALTTMVVPTPLTYYSGYYIINGGSGYTDGDDVVLDISVGSNGETAQLIVDIENGSISYIEGFNDDGALYTSKPTVNTSVNGGSGAVIEILFLADYRVIISNNGSNYSGFPEVYYNYTDYSSNVMRAYTDDLELGSYTDLVGGSIANDDLTDGDTIMYDFASATAPVFTVVNAPSKPIMLDIASWNINSVTGKINSVNTVDNGIGYLASTHPAVTFTTVGGYGSGASCTIDISSNGSLSEYWITNGGSGYEQNVNDFRDNGTTGDSYENPKFSTSGDYWDFIEIYNVMPGSEFIRSAHYGTGNPEEED